MTPEDEDAARGIVVARLRSLFDEWPAARAIELADHEPRWRSWGDVAALHRSLDDLMSAHQVPRDASIAVVMRQRPVMVAAELSVLAAGRAALLVTPLQSDQALADDVGSLRPLVLVAHADDWDRAGLTAAVAASRTLGVEVDDAFGVRVRVATGATESRPALDAAVTVLTSGTTGPPKRLPVSWATFVELGGRRGRPPTSDRGALILSLPLVTLGGLLAVANLVFGGRPMSMMERFDVRVWARLVREHRPTVIGAPPPVVQMILDAGISPDHFDGVTAFVTSSGPVPAHVAAAFEQRYGIPVLLGYGATEFLSAVTGWTRELWTEFGETKLGSVGRARPGVRLRVVDPDTPDGADPADVPVGEEGVLEVDPPMRAGHLPTGWLRTSDRARIDEDGFVWIVGRTDDVIVRGGFKVDLQHVEAALRDHPAVAAACAVGLPDDRLGHVPAAAVALADAVDPVPSDAELLTWVRDRLPPYSVPVSLKIVESIPQTTTFKAHRAAVRDLFLAG